MNLLDSIPHKLGAVVLHILISFTISFLGSNKGPPLPFSLEDVIGVRKEVMADKITDFIVRKIDCIGFLGTLWVCL